MTAREIEQQLKRVRQDIDSLRARQKELLAERDLLRRNALIRCSDCGKGTKVSKLTLIQTHWYRHPYSCTGGDYWVEGERQYVCPKCGRKNREVAPTGGLSGKQWNPRITELAPYFGSTEDSYDR